MAEEKTKSADEIFKEFKEHSITEFFRKNSQMLGYAGKVRSLTTIAHEYITNSLDACEEAGILPDIEIRVKEISENRYGVYVRDNGPGIPSKHVGKALASVLTGTKFHRYMQQRGQQGIGAGGCTIFALITTGRGIRVKSSTGKEAYTCDLSIDIKGNKPLVNNLVQIKPDFRGLVVEGEFGDVKYEKSEHGVYEYVRRTALSNPHTSIKLVEPDGNEAVFPRSVNTMPRKPRQILPHPLGISASDLLDFAHISESRKVTSFLVDSFSRVTHDKVRELMDLAKDVDFDKAPRQLTWEDATRIVEAFKHVKWIGPELDAMSTIGEKQIEIAIGNILNPKFNSVVERKPQVFKGGVPFVVEVGIAYGGEAGRKNGAAVSGNILRFANKVPLLFDTGSCAITEAVQGIDWKRYSIAKFDEEPVSVLVNVSSVYIPYSGVGKQAIAQEDEIVEEIKLAVQDAGRKLQRFLSGERHKSIQQSGYKTIMRYVSQLSSDLEEITGRKKEETEKELKNLIDKRYKSLFKEEDGETEQEEAQSAS
ncbi:MAG: DNA topoisomerase VI subunit B [Candidatus Micrarchaeota archaeon]|nr:DNA topoisomerase VI subunit B [Candidatus Micrarchaeota archaeon]